MSAVKKSSPATEKFSDLVFGLGDTGLSVARYLKRNGVDAVFVDSRNKPPGLNELQEMLPEAIVILGDSANAALEKIDRIIVSPGVADSEPMLISARKSAIDVVSDSSISLPLSKSPMTGRDAPRAGTTF